MPAKDDPPRDPLAAEDTNGLPSRDDYWALSRDILNATDHEGSWDDFLHIITEMLARFAGCDAVELRAVQEEECIRCDASLGAEVTFCCRTIPCTGDRIACPPNGAVGGPLDLLIRDVAHCRFDPSEKFFTTHGAFWASGVRSRVFVYTPPGGDERRIDLGTPNEFDTIGIVPLSVGKSCVGALCLKYLEPRVLRQQDIDLYRLVAQNFGVALAHRSVREELTERVKELTCLTAIAKLAVNREMSLSDLLHEIASLLPSAWKHPSVASARLVVDGVEYRTPRYRETPWKLSSKIVIHDVERGTVEVVYRERACEGHEAVFLKEERNLIDTIARELAFIIERRIAENEKKQLEEQLRHADRLATIGQLAAGVAHELNEPLGSVLGFAQLIAKDEAISDQTRGDVEKIVNAALHAREVIENLMLFARQRPTRKMEVDLNKVVKDGLYFLEARCAKSGVALEKQLAVDLPKIHGDRAQLHQVLVNLLVNAIQAMPEGGTLTVRTNARAGWVYLSVSDTGVGIERDVVGKIFLPFFTTKDVGEGTGLGLAVVHGIVTSHGGEIRVESAVGEGSRFLVSFPAARIDRDRSAES